MGVKNKEKRFWEEVKKWEVVVMVGTWMRKVEKA